VDRHAPLPVGTMRAELVRRRREERRLAYVECHDQSLVGDQALFFRLAGTDVYHHMAVGAPLTARLARAMALHKMARLLTCLPGSFRT
jgi:1,4-alpha-glucan branching enzyme